MLLHVFRPSDNCVSRFIRVEFCKFIDMPPILTVAQVRNHPEFPHAIWDLKPDKSGKLPVGAGRGGPINIYWEVHGHGPIKILFVMGLAGMFSAWQRQTKDFGHKQADKYTCLLLDNRGIGQSDKPFARYSTSEMAKDTLELLDHAGWTDPRSVNVVGISMGGMIIQELAMLAPERIASLVLTSTAAQIVNTIGFIENFRNRFNMLKPKSLDQQISNTVKTIFTKEYRESPDIAEWVAEPFPTSGDRYAAVEVHKRTNPQYFTTVGFLAQVVAAGWHHKSLEQLGKLADDVGRERICVIHGTDDGMIPFSHGETLLSGLNGNGLEVRHDWFEGQNHVIPMEKREEFNQILLDMIEKGQALNQK